MVQVAADEVVGVIAVGHGFVAAAGAVLMALLVFAAVVSRRARGRIGAADFELVLLDVLAVLMVQMAVVEIIDVAVVFHRGVAAVRTVLVVVVRVLVSQGQSPFRAAGAASSVACSRAF